MTFRIACHLALVPICLAFAACSESATEPEKAAVPAPSVPALAASSNIWRTRADMPTGRWDLATAVVTNAAAQSILYVIGGTSITTGGSLSKVEAYNVATNAWTSKAALPMPLYWTNGAGVINGKIYISGGLASNKNYRAELYMYDPATNKWTRKHDMPNTTFRGVTGVINGKLYVLTGCNQEDCYPQELTMAFYRYNPATDQRVTLPLPSYVYEWGWVRCRREVLHRGLRPPRNV